MPIKFRCQHCQQLLGISVSRAGAVVDCPQCGRSLRVPELDGKTRKLPDAKSDVRSDSALLTALSELSSLGDLEKNAPTEDGRRVPEYVASASHTAAVEAPRPAPERIEVEQVSVERIADTPTEVSLVEDGPFELSESLSEFVDGSDSLSDDLLTEMRQVSDPAASPLLLIFGGVLLLLLGATAGWWFGRSEQVNATAAAADNKPELHAQDRAVADAGGVTAGIHVSGTVEYQDASGRVLPDVGSLVLLLPAERSGTLLFQARALTRAPEHSDRIATLAGLSAVGGAVDTVDDEGHYQLASKVSQPSVVVVVSTHQARPADVSILPKLSVLLETWFDSTSHICGKLAVQSSEVTAAPSAQTLDFRFAAQE